MTLDMARVLVAPPADTTLRSATACVLDEAEAVIRRHAADDCQLALLANAVRSLRIRAGVGADADLPPPCIGLPLLAYAAVRGGEVIDDPAVRLAAATSLLFAGVDLFDDVADGDHSPEWAGQTPASMNLAAVTLLAALPQLAVADLDAPPAVRDRLQRTLAAGLVRMSAGQQRDLGHAGAASATSVGVEASVADKSGAEMAMFARLGAQLAGAPEAVEKSYARIGHAYGVGGQVASDCHELFDDPRGRDFAQGARTLPVVLWLERLPTAERAAAAELLEAARSDEAARAAVRSTVRGSGVLRWCAFLVETHCQRAKQILSAVRPLEPAAGWLVRMIESVSFFPPRGGGTPA